MWADRLAAIAHLLSLNDESVPKRSLTNERDAAALIANGIGALYEASDAIRRLCRAGVERLVPHSTSWVGLDALRKRWRDQLPIRNLRNQIAFHASSDKIRAGLDRYVRKRRRLLITARRPSGRGSFLPGCDSPCAVSGRAPSRSPLITAR